MIPVIPPYVKKSIVRLGARLLKASPIMDIMPPIMTVHRQPIRRIENVAIGPRVIIITEGLEQIWKTKVVWIKFLSMVITCQQVHAVIERSDPGCGGPRGLELVQKYGEIHAKSEVDACKYINRTNMITAEQKTNCNIRKVYPKKSPMRIERLQQ